MKNFVISTIFAATLLNAAAVEYPAFALGADISWYTQMEYMNGREAYSGLGTAINNGEGEPTTAPELVTAYGLDAVRLRVFVQPELQYCLGAPETWCDKTDLVAKARTCSDNGQRVMVDFHFSDNWCHPGQQWTPASWTDTSVEGLAKSASEHVRGVLSECKANGVEVAWVQIGNETGTGFLLQSPDGKQTTNYGAISSSGSNGFITIFNAAAEVVKEIYPEAKRILMTANGADYSKLSWTLNLVDKKLDYDLFGISMYPQVGDDTGSWCANTDKCVANVREIFKNYGRRVMVCETGMNSEYSSALAEWNAAAHSERCGSDQAAFMKYFIEALKGTGSCDGVFWWEPEVYSFSYQPWNPANPGWTMKQGAMTYEYRPNAMWDYLKSVSTFTPSASVGLPTIENGDEIRYFNLQGTPVATNTAPPGIYIRQAGDKTEKIIIR